MCQWKAAIFLDRHFTMDVPSFGHMYFVCWLVLGLNWLDRRGYGRSTIRRRIPFIVGSWGV